VLALGANVEHQVACLVSFLDLNDIADTMVMAREHYGCRGVFL